MKILITGVLGFIGRSLAEKIISENLDIEIYGIDIKDVNESNAEFVSKINYKNLDIRNEDSIKSYVAENNFDGIIHLAAVSRVVDAENDKKNCIATNYKGTKYISEAAKENPRTWMMFASSREVYGEQEIFPVSENAELLPYNVYGFYKLEAERAVRANVKKNCVLRFSNVYGNEYDIPGRVIPKFVKTAVEGGELALEGGKQIIDFTYADWNRKIGWDL